ncbi:MAG: 7TM-DISM domain-containing protein, partial [Caldimonas sp.]
MLDLRSWDFASAGALTLKGDWQFNWQELVAPDAHPAPDAWLPLRRWNGLKLFDGRTLPGKGFATYRMRVLLPAGAPDSYTLVLDPVIDACRLWITGADGETVGPIGGGEVGPTRERSHGSLSRTQLTFAAADEVTLTLQVSNFEHARGGSPGTSPLFGTAAAVESSVGHQRMSDFFFIGLLVITGLHHLVLFALRRRERAALWFAVMCLTIALRLFVLGRYLQGEWPSVPLWVPARLDYLTFYVAVPAASLFLCELFPNDLPRWLVRPIVAVSLGFVASLLLPVAIYSA